MTAEGERDYTLALIEIEVLKYWFCRKFKIFFCLQIDLILCHIIVAGLFMEILFFDTFVDPQHIFSLSSLNEMSDNNTAVGSLLDRSDTLWF